MRDDGKAGGSRPGGRLNRREFIARGGAAAAGLAGILTASLAPVSAQKRELTMLSWNHFVPKSDEELRRQAVEFGKQRGGTVQVDTIAHLQIPTKLAAEVQSQAGHDIVLVAGANPFLYEKQLVDIGDVVGNLGEQYGGWYPFAKESAYINGVWRGIPWFWISFPGTYNETLFKKYNVPVPDTWEDLLKAGRTLKKQGHPVGIAISHCADANTTFWSILWCYGGKVLEADGKTLALNSPQTEQVLEYYKQLFQDAMEPEVLSWDDASNNRFILSGKGSWIHNPISPYNLALEKKMPIVNDLNHHSTPAGPAGRHNAPPIVALGIWQFSRNIELAKEFIKYLFQEENFSTWIVASNAFNHGPMRHWEHHPVWQKDPKFKVLPKEGEFAHARGWPAPPNEVVQTIDNLYILPDMVGKYVQGTPAKQAIAWAEDQIKRIVEGKKG